MFLSLLPATALSYLTPFFVLLGGFIFAFNCIGICIIAKFTSTKFGYFIPIGVNLMATNALICTAMIFLRPTQLIISGDLYTLFMVEIPNLSRCYFVLLEILQIHAIFFGIINYVTMIMRYYRPKQLKTSLCFVGFFELLYIFFKIKRATSLDTSAGAQIKLERFLQQEQLLFVREHLEDIIITSALECLILALIFKLTSILSFYLFYILGHATPSDVLSKKMFFNNRLRLNIRICVFILQLFVSLPYFSRNIYIIFAYYLSKYPLSSTILIPVYFGNILGPFMVPTVLIFGYYCKSISHSLELNQNRVLSKENSTVFPVNPNPITSQSSTRTQEATTLVIEGL